MDETLTKTSPASEGQTGGQSASDPTAAVRQFVQAFNKGDTKAMAATCDKPMSILDGMWPHVWYGTTACEDWFRDVLTEGEHVGASGYRVAVDQPWHVNTKGDHAYVVVPASMSFKLRGQDVHQSGSVFTLSLRKVDGEWRIASWAWAKGTGQTGNESRK